MKKIIVVIGLSLFFATNLFCQDKFYLLPEAGIKWNLPQYASDGALSSSANTNFVWGLKAGFQLTANFALETGIYNHRFTNSYKQIYMDGFSGGRSFSNGNSDFISVPLLLKFQQGIFNNKIMLNTFFGPELMISEIKGEYYKSTIQEGFNDITITGTENAFRNQKTGMVFTSGVGIDIKLFKRLWLTSSFSTSLGRKTINTLEVDWQPQSETLQSDHLKSNWKGDSFNLKFGVKYNLW